MRTTFLLVLMLAAGSAFATNSRSAVSLTGSDANPCTPAAPCRSFAAAMPQTAAGGEIIALDSAGYGPFTIDRSVTVSGAPGVHAAITAASGGVGISVLATVSDHVVLRNPTLIGTGGGDVGINSYNLGRLVVSDVSVTGFSGGGIFVNFTAAFVIDRCQVVDNSGAIGIQIMSGGHGVISNSVISGNNDGVLVGGNCSVSIAHCDIVKNTIGVSSSGYADGTTADALVEDCSIVGNLDGVFAGSGGTGTSLIRLSNSVILGNGTGVDAGGGGIVYTYGNNKIDGNTTDTAILLITLSLR